MKKFKYLILSIFLLLLTTGCDGVYNVEIYNDQYKEDVTITETNVNNWYDKNEYGVTFKDLLDEEYDRDNYYYRKTLITDADKMGLNYKSDFTLQDYGSIGIGYRCYQYFRALDDGNKIIIMTSDRNTCYDDYKWLDNLTINVKTNHKVLEHNADEVNGNTYTWHLTRQNASDKMLEIQLSKNKYVVNYDNEIIKNIGMIVGIALGVIALIVGIVMFFRAKGNLANRI